MNDQHIEDDFDIRKRWKTEINAGVLSEKTRSELTLLLSHERIRHQGSMVGKGQYQIGLPSWADATGIVRSMFRWVLNNVSTAQIVKVKELTDHLKTCGYNLPIELEDYLESVSEQNFDHFIQINIHAILMQTQKLPLNFSKDK